MFAFLLIVQSLVAISLVGVILMQRLSIAMAAIAGATRETAKIDTSLANSAAPIEQSKPVQPMPPATQQQDQQAPAVPLAQ